MTRATSTADMQRLIEFEQHAVRQLDHMETVIQIRNRQGWESMNPQDWLRLYRSAVSIVSAQGKFLKKIPEASTTLFWRAANIAAYLGKHQLLWTWENPREVTDNNQILEYAVKVEEARR